MNLKKTSQALRQSGKTGTKKKKKSPKKTLKKQADEMWGLSVRKRDKHICRKCGASGNNPHHIFSRTYLGTRHLVDNGLTVCWACHMHFFHGKPEEARDWYIREIGSDKYAQLKLSAMAIVKPDYALRVDILHNYLLRFKND